MKYKNLLKYAKDLDSILFTKLSIAFSKYSKEQEFSDAIEIDIFELESLVNPNKFDFPKSDIGDVIVEE